MATPDSAEEGIKDPATRERREIPGNFSYTTTPGVLSKVLTRLITSERPPVFTPDFLNTVLQCTGGSSRPIIPIFKKVGLLASDGKPTERYAQFQSDGKRAQAALDAARQGWVELFRKNRYAHKLEKGPLEDLFVEITGLTKTDPVFKNIVSTYNVFQEYAKKAEEGVAADAEHKPEVNRPEDRDGRESFSKFELGLSNQINIILPETTDISVYHAIFRALKENIL